MADNDIFFIILKYYIIIDCPHGELVRNGVCNDEVNNAECIFDGGDCCGHCVNKEYCTHCECIGNNTNKYGLSNSVAGDNGISNSMIGNGFCEDEINTVGCAFDGFDCCGSNTVADLCSECTCHGNVQFFVSNISYFLLEIKV